MCGAFGESLILAFPKWIWAVLTYLRIEACLTSPCFVFFLKKCHLNTMSLLFLGNKQAMKHVNVPWINNEGFQA